MKMNRLFQSVPPISHKALGDFPASFSDHSTFFFAWKGHIDDLFRLYPIRHWAIFQPRFQIIQRSSSHWKGHIDDLFDMYLSRDLKSVQIIRMVLFPFQ